MQRKLSKVLLEIKNAERINVLVTLLAFAAAIISLYPSASFLVHAYAVDGFSRQTSDYLFSDTIIGLFMMLPSLFIFCTGYLLFKSHSLGWKMLILTAFTVFVAGFLNYISLGLSLAIAFPSILAVGIVFLRRKERSRKDPAIAVEQVAKVGMVISAAIGVSTVVFLFVYAGIRGAPYLTWDFWTNTHWQFLHAGSVLNNNSNGPVAGIAANSLGGIAGYTIGSLLLASTCELIALPLGLGAAIYLSEYAKQNIITETIRFFIETLAGIPSVVIGLLGYVLLVQGTLFQMGFSLSTASIALAIMILPFNIRVAEEAMRSVPASYREGSYALGATQWETVKRIVLFAAAPGIITGVLLGLGAAIGESAVVYLTAGFPPVGPATLPPLSKIFSAWGSFPALPVLILRAPTDLQIGVTNPISSFNFDMYSVAFAASFVLIAIYLSICAVALVARNRLAKKIAGR